MSKLAAERAGLALVFRQMLEGWDIPAPEGMLKIKAESANRQIEGLPYSIATNLAHAVLWQDFWLDKLKGGKQKSGMEQWEHDFDVPEPNQWNELRSRFVAGLKEAMDYCTQEEFKHQAANDDAAVETLTRIATHGAYHIGQLNLLKRAMRSKGAIR
ncbi:DinB family protein [Kamptonema cortianum]|nr:DinB family protein [Geitlerinema splendidum]MDK3155980.1 DinB family protein [Kamptonema cortianum]